MRTERYTGMRPAKGSIRTIIATNIRTLMERHTPITTRMTVPITITNMATRTTMPRVKGSGQLGPVRSLRLPLGVDRWFEERLREEADVPASELLLRLIHSGLRLRAGYMRRHYERLRRIEDAGDASMREGYLAALYDAFGELYVAHLVSWLAADDVLKT